MQYNPKLNGHLHSRPNYVETMGKRLVALPLPTSIIELTIREPVRSLCGITQKLSVSMFKIICGHDNRRGAFPQIQQGDVSSSQRKFNKRKPDVRQIVTLNLFSKPPSIFDLGLLLLFSSLGFIKRVFFVRIMRVIGLHLAPQRVPCYKDYHVSYTRPNYAHV